MDACSTSASRRMASLVSQENSSTSSRRAAAKRPIITLRSRTRATAQPSTVQLVVRVATRDAQLARCALHGLLGAALGVHTIDIDRRTDLACLHIEVDRRRVADAMTLLMRTIASAEFGTVRQLDRAI